MDTRNDPLPEGYRTTLRVLIRYAAVMLVLLMLVGLAYRESTKKLTYEMAAAGLHLEAVIGLGLVHGHFALLGVLLPLGLAGALLLARRAGGGDVGLRTQRLLCWAYLPGASLSLVLQLVKGYHVLLAVRGGDADFAGIEARFLGGSEALRYVLFGAAHGGMALGLVVFAVSLWRSLAARPA